MSRLIRTLCKIGVVFLALAACSEPSSAPEEQLRAWVSAGVEAATDKKRRELIDMISVSYTDARGNERADIENLLRVYFLRQHKIALLTSIEEITVYDDTAAKIKLTVGMAGMNDSVLGLSADAYRFEFELENDADEWQLISARWGELGDELR